MNERIKKIRQDAGLTQEAFAAKLGLTRNYIAQIEMGAKKPSDRTVNAICLVFDIREEWVRTGEGKMKPQVSREQEMAELVARLMQDSPNSFRCALVETLLRFDPNGPEWEILEQIYEKIAARARELQKEEHAK